MQIDKLTLHFLGLYFVCSYDGITCMCTKYDIALFMQFIHVACNYIAKLLHLLP